MFSEQPALLQVVLTVAGTVMQECHMVPLDMGDQASCLQQASVARGGVWAGLLIGLLSYRALVGLGGRGAGS